MLSQKYAESQLKNMLLTRNQWQPFPNANNRSGWQTLPETVKQAQITRGEKHLITR